MSLYLGIDTSNYTTSAALFDSEGGKMYSCRKLLPVKKGEAGLRQSDAVFHHTVQLPQIIGELREEYGEKPHISAVGVSSRPRNIDGSYMPCFLCGEGLASAMGDMLDIPVHRTSHQVGHILAALFSAGKLELIRKPFIAFHVSGGTTDCLFCEPDVGELIKADEIASSLDLKAGQLIDRTGLMLGLDFPCGPALERLAAKSSEEIAFSSVMRNGSCCLSGFQNKAEEMLKRGVSAPDIAMYIQGCIAKTVWDMTAFAKKQAGGDIPVIYAGGVMSNKFIREYLEKRTGNIFFAEPCYSADNAAGVALFAYFCNERL